ncbi:Ribosomal protein S18 acetylase RimI [Saccharopolyspora antimicrobica]|uniref:Ribosomal protein S18 acetylase RimI n=1 Tax=Saccharopolyspora antimicrobica TaxID=455193 RepID=A0A1I4U2Z6_9PSEU|nr:GNAT family N-acetyltransferase [Saccharopolyspora antimicrobica]RKT88657.1 ribosomal protein S18 acetylase RimI-like enzyme [Saccharopolyspora antimicrobica]SFM83305.1 Ribosomal protein S18 acetylase RimI [Saccharopolyspora antimicrobica]
MSESDVDLVPMWLPHLPGVLELGNRVFDVSEMPYTSWSLSSAAVHLDAQPDACWVAEAGGRVAGFVLGSLSYDERADWGYVEWLAVDPEHQGRGLAKTLLEESCAALFAAGATRVITDVEQTNTASAHLMRRCGFNDSVTVTLFVRHAPADSGASRQARVRAHSTDPAKARLHAAARKSERD